MKIYIAGPMTPTRFDQEDRSNHEYSPFHEAEERLRAAGHQTFNPATNQCPHDELGGGYAEDPSYEPLTPEEWSALGPVEYAAAYREVMSRDVRWIMQCDGIALLKGWRRSQGAMFEHSVGAMLGLYISNVEDFESKPDDRFLLDRAFPLIPEFDVNKIRAVFGLPPEVSGDELIVTNNGGALCPGIESPHYEGDVGYDLVCADNVWIDAGAFEDVDVNLRVALPTGTWGLITGRSSTFRKHGLLVLQGVIDEGYRGPIRVGITNTTKQWVEIKKGSQLAQLIVLPRNRYDLRFLHDLPPGDRGDAAFGSTDSPGGS